MGVAALSIAALCLSASTAMFSEFSVLFGTIGRENAAREAMIISRAYFVSNQPAAYEYEQSGMPAANPRPITEIPGWVFEPIAGQHPGTAVEGVIIDLNYDVSFVTEARRLGIPHGVPSLITSGREGVAEKKYRARRYELRTKATFSGRLPGSCSMRLGLLVLDDGETAFPHVIDLYAEK